MATLTPAPEVDGVVVVAAEVHGDERGTFVETYRRSWFPGQREMVQANRAERSPGTVVGLHYHLNQADYWSVVRGHARVVLHDLRQGSPTKGATLHLDLGEVDGAEHNQLGVYIPPGVAHGFAAVTALTLTYLVDAYYDPADELGVAWDDPAIGADWRVDDPLLSDRDRANPRRDAIEPVGQPRHRPRT